MNDDREALFVKADRVRCSGVGVPQERARKSLEVS